MADRGAFTVAGRELRSRLLLGTGGIPSLEVLDEVLAASGTALATVALRRVDPGGRGSILDGALFGAGSLRAMRLSHGLAATIC